MKQLELALSYIGDGRMKVFAHSYGSADSFVPFDKGSRRITVLKALNALNLHLSDYEAEEQAWMVDNKLLTCDKRTFDSSMLENIGNMLYEALFPKDSSIESALSNLMFEGGELHIQIEVQGEAGDIERHRLFDYPWELLCRGRDFLVERGINISRYIAFGSASPKLPSLSHINVLLVSPRASDQQNDLKPLSDEESQAVRKALEQAQSEERIADTNNTVNIHIDELSPPVTLNKLSRYVREHIGENTPHVIHFDGHGHFGVLCRNPLSDGEECNTFNPGMAQQCKNTQCGAPLADHQGYLLFEDDRRGPHYVSAQNVAALLGAANRINKSNHGITLVVLSACKSGFSIAGNSVFNGIAQRLIHQRIPAVVGMAFTVRVDSTITFMDCFYRSLRQKLPLVASVSWGRREMLLDGNQWYRPVLYMRWQDHEGGQLFARQSAATSSRVHIETRSEIGQKKSDWEDISPDVLPPGSTGAEPVQADILSSAIACYKDIKAKKRQLLPFLVLFNALRIENIPAAEHEFVARSPLIKIQDIWPDHCERALVALQDLVQPVQKFYDLLDKALAREFTPEVIRLRSALMTPLRIIGSELTELISLITRFSKVCRSGSFDVINLRREIKEKLASLQESLNKVKNPMDL